MSNYYTDVTTMHVVSAALRVVRKQALDESDIISPSTGIIRRAQLCCKPIY